MKKSMYGFRLAKPFFLHLKHCILLISLLNLFTTNLTAQVTTGATAAALAANIAGSGVIVSSPILTCAAGANAIFAAPTSIGFTNGILLSNGNAAGAFGPTPALGYLTGGLGIITAEPELSALVAGAAIADVCKLEFDVVPLGSNLSLTYVFGSDEYISNNCNQYNDIMGVFITGGTYGTATNIATIPIPPATTNVPVCVNSINTGDTTPCDCGACCAIANCHAMGPGSPFSALYINNAGSAVTEYRGISVNLQATTNVVACTKYHLKIVIADVADGGIDAGVFVKKGSLTSPSAPGISGSTTITCPTLTSTLSYPTGGGTWSSSNPSVGTVGLMTGVVTGLTAGTSIITYRMSPDCYATTTVTVVLSGVIGGTPSVCVGHTTTLTPSGGTWSSSTPSVATVGPATGVVTGVTAGTAIITHISSGCTSTVVVTVNPLPSVISGGSIICGFGSSITLSDATAGGTWSSSNTAVGTIGLTTGILTGLSTGTTIISYILPTNCYRTTTVTVYPSLDPITGVSVVCVGGLTLLSNTSLGGTWTSSNTVVANFVSPTSGILIANAAGTTTVVYISTTGCTQTTIVTVNPLPSPIIGPATVCVGSTITLTDTSGSGTWSSSNLTVATIGSGTGIVTGGSPGTATIAFTLSSTGCVRATIITVNPLPASITGTGIVCVGSTITLSDVTPSGHWSSSDNSIATVGSSTGIVTGVSAAAVSIFYTLPTGCRAVYNIGVIPPISPIGGDSVVCAGDSITLTGFGVWTSSNTAVATVGSSTGKVTGVAAGTSVITCTLTSTCGTHFATKVVTVNAAPGPITGVTTTCSSVLDTLHDAVSGGTWTHTNGTISVMPAGNDLYYSGLHGIDTMTYTLSDGCKVSTVVTIYLNPSDIFGSLSLCVVDTTTLVNFVSGGVWTSSNTAVATIGSSTGLVTSVGAGTTTISYVAGGGCYATTILTVNPIPASITGTMTMCPGSSTTLSDATAGGSWYSGNASVATVGLSTGIVTGVASGTATISYGFSGICFATAIVTVNPLPAFITGTLTVCTSSSTTLSTTTTGGTWSSSNTAVATVGSVTGIVTGVSAGTSTITYLGSNGCSTTAIVTVYTTPASITGTFAICAGTTTALSNSVVGGTWSSINPSVASVGSSSGVVVAGSVGTVSTAVITYNTGGACNATVTVTVNPLPGIIGGPTFSVCTGSTITLTGSIGGGTWSSSNPSIDTVGLTTGVVHGISAGGSIITYTLSTGCSSTAIVNVLQSPAPITGIFAICLGASTTLVDVTNGGTWSSSTPSVAPVDPFGTISGLSVGTAIISYTVSGCSATATVTVNPLPNVIAGSLAICKGTTTTLSDATGGGTWSSSDTGIATIGSSTGIVSGINAGTTTITYELSTGCLITATLTVNSLPAAIVGTMVFCQGITDTLTDSTTGGVWTSGNPSVANILFSTGVVTGVSGGTAAITYTLPTFCYATTVVTVHPLPIVGAIVCPDTVCIRSVDTLSDITLGGLWTTSDSGIATILPISGGYGVAGVSAGTAIISYTVINGCGATIVTKTITVTGAPVAMPITGVLGVCSGFTDTLHEALTGGIWSSSSPGIASIDAATGIVTGITDGSVTITYSDTTACGTAHVTTNVLVNMEPYITSNFIVACQTLSHDIKDGTVISGETACILVCDSTVVRYYANGVAGSAFTWNIAGGTVVTAYPPENDSIDVFWQTVGLVGSISLHDTFSHCIDSATACIKVIDKPRADFWTASSNYCMGNNIVFHDLSTGDPSSSIAYYHWNFGDGTGSSASGTAEHSYSLNGTYTVTLTVKNACNCTDSVSFVLVIDKVSGPDIQCPSIVCDSEYATYSTSASCSIFDWSVVGGTIISGIGTSSILVHWDMVDSTGFGYVSLATPGCSVCSDTTTIKVPVIMQSPLISGPHTICAGVEYTYSLPLWPATDYKWGILDSSSAIFGCHNDHSMIALFNTPGTYVIHGWYANRIKLCGGNVFDTVTVVPSTAITGTAKVCADPAITQTYSVSGGYTADWRLKDNTGALITTTTSSTTFGYIFAVPGTYLLCASGAFCADSFTITVLPIPNAIDSVTGPDTVCLNRTYTYKAWNDIPSTIYSWEAVGGTVSPASGTNVVSVIWTSSGTKQLKVRHVSRASPYCEGPQTIITITQEVVALDVTGDSAPCANAYRTYNSNYTRGETYDWAIYPDSAGSVVSGNHGDSMRVLWNNATTITTANIVVKVNKCDSVYTDTLNVSVQPSMGITLSASSSPECPGVPIVFTATTGGILYIWNFGDGTGSATTSVNVSPPHSFPVNITTGNITYHVKVNILPDPAAICPVADSATFAMVIKPGPVAYASAAAPMSICLPGDKLVAGTVTSNVGVLSYQWNDHGSPISGATDVTYLASDTGKYSFTVIATNGCSATSNDTYVQLFCLGSGVGGCLGTVTAATSNACNTITLASTAGTFISWTADVQPVGWTSTVFLSDPVTVSYTVPGIYNFHMTGISSGCVSTAYVSDSIGIVANFRYSFQCAAGGFDSVMLSDYSAYLPWWGIDSVQWRIDGVYEGTAPNLSWALAAGTTHTIKETVYGTKPGGTYICDNTRSVTVPIRPVASFTFSPSPICENVPISFTSVPGYFSYKWNFGDSASILLPNAERNYTWTGPLANPQPFHVTLTVIDSIGCTADTTQDVNIFHNTLFGHMDDNATICQDAVPYGVNYISSASGTSPYSYTWSTGTFTTVPTLGVFISGSYWTMVSDFHQCRFTPAHAENVKVLNVPPATIFGVQHYCIGEDVQLYGYEGTGASYQWYRDDTLISTASAITDAGLPLGHYGYKLVITILDTVSGISCTDTSAIDSIRIYGLPDPPVITGPVVLDCGTYHLQLTATEPVSGTYDWSNGVYTAVNNIDMGGPYRVWFTDLHGCINHADTTVPLSPDYYFAYFPTGCYDLCREQLPLTLFGPPCVVFDSSEWFDSGTPVAGSAGIMVPYTIINHGSFQWTINNGLCTKTSGIMDAMVSICDNCQGVGLNAKLTCDTTNPASYSIDIFFNNPGSGTTTFTLGTDIGPIAPFSGTVSTSTFSSTLTFTTLMFSPLPDSVTVELALTLPSGSKCFEEVRVAVPYCHWQPERNASNTNHGSPDVNNTKIGSALLVFPNPTSGVVTLSYDYGSDGTTGRVLAVYDAMGRRMGYTIRMDTHGTWQLNTSSWAPGVYIIRMEGDGKALQVQQMVIIH